MKFSMQNLWSVGCCRKEQCPYACIRQHKIWSNNMNTCKILQPNTAVINQFYYRKLSEIPFLLTLQNKC